jgi:hypothetical protein
VVVAREIALRITATLNDKGVGRCSCNSNNNNAGRLLVQASAYERHLLTD